MVGRQKLAHGDVLGHLESRERLVLVLLVHHPSRLIDEGPYRLVLGHHVGDLELDALVHGDGLAEGLPLLDVVDAYLHRPLGGADAAGGDEHPGRVEALHRQVEAPPSVSDLVLVRDLHVRHLEAAGADGHPAVVVEPLRHLDARVVEGEVEGCHAPVALRPVAVSGDEITAADFLALRGAADVGLLAVHDPVALAPLEGSLEARDVRPASRLGDTYADKRFAPGRLPQALVPDDISAELVDNVTPAGLDEEEDRQRNRDVGVPQLLGGYGRRHPVCPGPAVLLRQRHAEEPEVPDPLYYALRQLVILVVLPDLLHRKVLREPLPHRLSEEFLFLSEREIYHTRLHPLHSYICPTLLKV